MFVLTTIRIPSSGFDNDFKNLLYAKFRIAITIENTVRLDRTGENAERESFDSWEERVLKFTLRITRQFNTHKKESLLSAKICHA